MHHLHSLSDVTGGGGVGVTFNRADGECARDRSGHCNFCAAFCHKFTMCVSTIHVTLNLHIEIPNLRLSPENKPTQPPLRCVKEHKEKLFPGEGEEEGCCCVWAGSGASNDCVTVMITQAGISNTVSTLLSYKKVRSDSWMWCLNTCKETSCKINLSVVTVQLHPEPL